MDRSTKLNLVSAATGAVIGIYHQDLFYGCFWYFVIFTLSLIWACLSKYIDGDQNNEPKS